MFPPVSLLSSHPSSHSLADHATELPWQRWGEANGWARANLPPYLSVATSLAAVASVASLTLGLRGTTAAPPWDLPPLLLAEEPKLPPIDPLPLAASSFAPTRCATSPHHIS